MSNDPPKRSKWFFLLKRMETYARELDEQRERERAEAQAQEQPDLQLVKADDDD